MNFVKRNQRLLSFIFLLALIPASASAVTITISALSDSATEITLTATGTYYFANEYDILLWSIGNYVAEDGPNAYYANLSAGILANGVAATKTYLDNDGGGNDDFKLRFGTRLWGSYTVSGSATADLSGTGHTFGKFNIGTYEDGGDTVIVQYSSVPDTGSTAALLGVGVFVLAAARRRLG